jgi:LCP family protein required for cell wall assembly
VREGRRHGLRRTWPQRLLITLNALAIVAAAVVATSLAYSNDQVAQINRKVFEGGVLANEELETGDPQNFLLVGVDDASGLDEGDVVRRRPTGTKLTDTIMVLRVDPQAGTADIVSFPRDLLVDIPGRTSRARINSAFETGGPDLLVQTIAENFGIPVHHYLEVDFAGFRELVQVVGGIPVYFPHPVRSADSVTLEIPAPGCWVLGPVQALGFARARKDYQVQDADGDWHTDLGGDYSRVERQQLFIQLALRQAIAKGARNLNTLRRLIDLGIASVTIDDALEPEMIVDLSRSFRSFDPAELVTHTLPVDEAAPGGPAYLYLREEEAEPILAIFRGGDPGMAGDIAPVTTDQVTVQVRNGTGTENQATDVSGLLADVGFNAMIGADGSPGFPTVVQTGSDWAGVRTTPQAYSEVPGPTVPDPTATSDTSTTGSEPLEDLGSTTTPGASTTDAEVEQPGDVDDPDEAAFYRATVPPPGSQCQPTT